MEIILNVHLQLKMASKFFGDTYCAATLRQDIFMQALLEQARRALSLNF